MWRDWLGHGRSADGQPEAAEFGDGDALDTSSGSSAFMDARWRVARCPRTVLKIVCFDESDLTWAKRIGRASGRASR